MQISKQIRPIQQCFVYKIKITYEEKLTSLAANCATGCLHNELHMQLCVQISTQIRPSQQCFVYKIKLTHEEKLTSLAANCANGCLHNELHMQLCVMELLGELSSAWDDYSGRTSDLQHTGSGPA